MTTCVHHWDIEPANGPTSPGVCRNCGDAKQFVNHSAITAGTWRNSKGKSLPFRLTNRENHKLMGDLQVALNLTTDYTRK